MKTPEYAPVGPLPALRRLAEEGLLGHYQLLIAPVVLQREEAYRTFFGVHDDQFVIMDNGVIEVGYPLPVGDLYRAVRMTNASLLVLPDTIDDMKMTVKQVRAALPAYRKLDTITDVLGVVQGTTFEECMECARILVEEGVDWLSIPRGLTPHLGTRVDLTRAIGVLYQKPMHILGFSNNLQDDMLTASAHPLVRGIDAATPVWAPRPFPLDPPHDEAASLHLGRRPLEFWHMPAAEPASHNVVRVHEWLTAGLKQNIATGVRIPAQELAGQMDLSMQM